VGETQGADPIDLPLGRGRRDPGKRVGQRSIDLEESPSPQKEVEEGQRKAIVIGNKAVIAAQMDNMGAEEARKREEENAHHQRREDHLQQCRAAAVP